MTLNFSNYTSVKFHEKIFVMHEIFQDCRLNSKTSLQQMRAETTSNHGFTVFPKETMHVYWLHFTFYSILLDLGTHLITLI